MEEFSSINELAKNLKTKLDNKKILLLYAFNSTGKTRLSTEFNDIMDENQKVLCYNAFVEDFFRWDNDNYILSFDPNSWIADLIKDQGIENNINNNFKNFINTKIEPMFDLDNGQVIFNIATGDTDSLSNIKISKGEESMFIWSIFYTILEVVIDELNTDQEDRSTNTFNSVEYIIIDDPVSSIDDTKLIKMALKLIKTVCSSKDNNLNFIFTTHHPLFYNVLFNNFKRMRKKNSDNNFILSKTDNNLQLKKLKSTPFGYHLVVKEEIDLAIKNNNIKKYHFNLFRTILEKTANFLGYPCWKDCINGFNRDEVIKLIDLFSHDDLPDLEFKSISDNYKELFKESYNNFITDFKWKVNQP